MSKPMLVAITPLYLPFDMNSLNALGNRQVASLQADLGRMEMGEGGPSVQGE